MGFSRQEYWSGLPLPSPLDHVLSELFTMTCLSWVALYGMAHSYMELDIVKDPDAGKDWRQEEKGMTEDEIVGWHHWFNGHEFEKTLGVGDGRESLVCCSPWGCKESDMTEWLNWILLVTRERQIKTRMKYCFLLTQMAISKILTLPTVGKVVKQLKHWYIFVEV